LDTIGSENPMRRREVWLPLVALTLLALAVRLPWFFDGFYGDEAFTYDDVVHRTLADAMGRVREYEDTPPFFFLIEWGAAKFGDPAVWLRLPAFICGTALVPLSYLLGMRVAGRRAAIIGAGLLAVSPFAVRFSSEARAYSLLALLVVASTLALVVALERPERRWPWAAFAALTVATLYTHYTAFFIVLAQALWAFTMNRRQWRPLVLSYGAALLAAAPWMLTRPEGHGLSFAVLYPFSTKELYKFWAQSVVGSPQIGIQKIPGPVGWYLLAAMACVVVAGLALGGRRSLGRPSSGAVLIVVLALAAPLGVLVYTLAETSVVAGRNMFASAPFAFLTVGLVLAKLRPAALAVAVALGAGALVLGLAINKTDDQWHRPAWKQAASFVNARARATDPVVIGNPFGPPAGGERDISAIPMRLYLDRPDTLVGLFSGDRDGFASLEPRGRVFVVVPSLIGGEQAKPPRPGRGFELEASDSWRGLTPIAVYAYRRRLPDADRVRLVHRDGGGDLLAPGGSRSPVVEDPDGGFLEGAVDEEDHLTASGWAVDPATGEPPDEVLIFDGPRLMGRAAPDGSRPDIAKRFGPKALRSGFHVELLSGRGHSLIESGALEAVAVRGRSAWLVPALDGAFAAPAD
jgi:Dolichyl-phosphate-mannose-protein mannosyltransferase